MHLANYLWIQEISGEWIYIPDQGCVKHRAPSLIIRPGITNSRRDGTLRCLHVHVNVKYCLIVSLLTGFNCPRASLGNAITAHKEGSGGHYVK